jgi:hypothetical protein
MVADHQSSKYQGRINVRINVRFGSKADIEAPPTNVRFTPKSGHSKWRWSKQKNIKLKTLTHQWAVRRCSGTGCTVTARRRVTVGTVQHHHRAS